MARKLFFFKNVEFRYLKISIFDNFDNNFIFFKKFNKLLIKNNKVIKLKKINFNTQCVNVLYF